MILSGDRCQCPKCAERFNSTSAFDKHRIGDYAARRCPTAPEMLAVGMSVNARGFWITSKFQSEALGRIKRAEIAATPYVGSHPGEP